MLGPCTAFPHLPPTLIVLSGPLLQGFGGADGGWGEVTGSIVGRPWFSVWGREPSALSLMGCFAGSLEDSQNSVCTAHSLVWGKRGSRCHPKPLPQKVCVCVGVAPPQVGSPYPGPSGPQQPTAQQPPLSPWCRASLGLSSLDFFRRESGAAVCTLNCQGTHMASSSYLIWRLASVLKTFIKAGGGAGVRETDPALSRTRLCQSLV